MAKQEFLDNFRIARNLFAHPRVLADNGRIDLQSLEQTIARAAIWLTPKSVKGFDASDFPELGPNGRAELLCAVDDFLAVAKQIPPSQPATGEELRAAESAFRRILAIVQPYLPTPHEAEKVEEALKNVEFPSWIANWDYKLATDEVGAPIVLIYLYADEASAPRKEFGQLATQMEARIREELMAVGSTRWPYVRMRTAFEHKMV